MDSRLSSRGASTVSTMSEYDDIDHAYEKPDQQIPQQFHMDDSLETDRMLDEISPSSYIKKRLRTPGRSLRLLVILVCGIWLLAAFFYLSLGYWRVHTHAPISHERRMSFADSRGFGPLQSRIDWIKATGEDGVYLIRKNGHIMLAHVNGTETPFIQESNIVATNLKEPRTLAIEEYWISPDMQFLLIATDIRRNWRHSFFARYWLYEVATNMTTSLVPLNVNAKIAFATWSPTGHSLAYVTDNDLWLRVNMQAPLRLTSDGSESIFNGIPDWVYEEEVYQTNSAIWWASDSSSLTFLKTNETAVSEYPLSYFISPKSDEIELYPDVEQLKYPKPGTANPVVSLLYYDILKGGAATTIDVPSDFIDTKRLITEVKWLGAETLFLRETNRDSVIQKTMLAQPRQGTIKVSETLNITEIDGGWFEVSRHTHYLPAHPENGRSHDGFIDSIIHSGCKHLALFSLPDASEPIMLTSGDWEVVDGVQGIDLGRNLVYFLATRKSGIDRHLYSVNIQTLEVRAITPETEDAVYASKFSPGCEYYVLDYLGPGIPWQEIRSVSNSTFRVMLQDNHALKEKLSKYDLPQLVHSQITVDGLQMNVAELRPPNFDESGKTKYPVLFKPYGGPMSQQVTRRFGIDWHYWLASAPTMEYVIVTVDGRGTGNMGRPLRVPVRGQMGKWEANDQIAAAQIWKEKAYTDSNHFAIWGWSFGGYLTLKVLEAGSGLFQYGMAVAPVTDWRYYDSIYTERYMGTVEDNKDGYEQTAISNIEAFRNVKRFLIMHGTGDDNVHYQNTLAFVDKLNNANIENYDMHIFPDSDHSIYFHSANTQVFHRLAAFLQQAFGVRDPLAEDRTWKADGWKEVKY